LLFQTIEAKAIELQIKELTSAVSITARPFFESRGFNVVTPQEVFIGDVGFRNYKMLKVL